MTGSRKLLLAAGGSSLLVAVFQVVISFFPDVSLYFGAPEFLVARRLLLLAAGLVAGLFFIGFGLYGLSGARVIRPLPWLKAGLAATGLIYTARGLAVIPVLLIRFGVLRTDEPLIESALISSLVSLAIGGLYLAGTIGAWKDLAHSGTI
ncbi:MAG: hypothetical protein KKB20_11985 [Proteobacteria bacterium]|nr:hypothetical protein [Pseudomonadota bacterium]